MILRQDCAFACVFSPWEPPAAPRRPYRESGLVHGREAARPVSALARQNRTFDFGRGWLIAEWRVSAISVAHVGMVMLGERGPRPAFSRLLTIEMAR